jgi:hypothetical protein
VPSECIAATDRLVVIDLGAFTRYVQSTVQVSTPVQRVTPVSVVTGPRAASADGAAMTPLPTISKAATAWRTRVGFMSTTLGQ